MDIKKIAEIKEQNKAHAISLHDVYISFLKNEYIHITYNNSIDVYIIELLFDGKFYEMKNYNKIESKKQEIEKRIIDSIFLLKFLKENRFLFEITNGIESENFDITRNDYDKSNHLRFNSDFDKSTTKFILNTLLTKQYVIRQEFVEFVNNKFLTTEDIRFKKGQIATYLSIIVAFLIGIGSIVLTIIGSYKNNDAQIQQFNHIDSTINKFIDNKKSIYKKDSLLLDSIHHSMKNLIEQSKLNRPLNKIDAFITNFPDKEKE